MEKSSIRKRFSLFMTGLWRVRRKKSGREQLLHCIMNVCELGSMSWHKVILIEYRRNG